MFKRILGVDPMRTITNGYAKYYIISSVKAKWKMLSVIIFLKPCMTNIKWLKYKESILE